MIPVKSENILSCPFTKKKLKIEIAFKELFCCFFHFLYDTYFSLLLKTSMSV